MELVRRQFNIDAHNIHHFFCAMEVIQSSRYAYEINDTIFNIANENDTVQL
jgi:hypothetical protein